MAIVFNEATENRLNNKEFINKVREAYYAVFDEFGNVKACGRGACKKLIKLLNDNVCAGQYGDEETGLMKVNRIKNVCDNIMHLSNA